MVWNYRCKTCARSTSRRSVWRHTGVVVGVRSAALLMILAAITPDGVTAAKYPQDALRCLASLKEPEGLLICPEHRNAYCVKEVSTLTEADCGRTTYYGDKWNIQTNKCEYRKCEASCEESSWDFEFEGEPYERNRFCCDFNFCNGATSSLPRPSTPALMSGIVGLLLAQAYIREQQAG